MARRTCPACSADITPGKRFCVECGYQLLGRSIDTAHRAVQAIAIVFAGVFGTLLLGLIALPEAPTSTPAAILESSMFTTGFVLCGLLALTRLGPGAWDESLGARCGPRELGLGVVVSLAGFAVSAAYVALVKGAFGVDESTALAADEFSPPLAVAVLTVVVLPAFNEEWTDRGVLWVALRKVSGPGTTILCTALLFAFMHGLGGAGLLEVPHRFALGLLYGYLRHRTGSLWPGIVAHALHNTLSLVW